MACNVQIPVDDIAEEVKQLLNLDQYVKQDNGTATNLTLKGGVVLDTKSAEDLCRQLAECINTGKVVSLERDGDTISLALSNGETFTVNLSDYVTTSELSEALQDVVASTNGTATNLTLKGGVTLDSATKKALCAALSDCFEDNYVSEFRLDGSNLEMTLANGGKKTVDLSAFNTPDKHVTDFAVDDAQAHIVLTLSSGEKYRISKEELAAFLKSELQGLDGKSAYDLWLEAGNTGSEQDFLDSLKGAKGDRGATGPKGADGARGPEGSQGATGPTGPAGPAGPTGPQGPAGPRGPAGPQGPAGSGGAGSVGPKGEPGKSAYQIWLDNGNQGSEQDFLNSLKGTKGPKGDRGEAGPAGSGSDLDLSNLPTTTWKDGTSVLVRQDGALKHMVPQEALFQEIGVGMSADKLADFTGKEFDVVVTVTNSGRNPNTETDLVITKPSNSGYTMSDFRPAAPGATIERIDDLNYKIKDLQPGGTGTVRFKVRTNDVGTYQFGASINPNTLLDMKSNNNTASITLSARASTARQDEVGRDCPVITASYKGQTVPVILSPGVYVNEVFSKYNHAGVKGSLKGVVIDIPQATTVVLRSHTDYNNNQDGTELLIDDTNVYAAGTFGLSSQLRNPLDEAVHDTNLISGRDYTFSDGKLTITKDTGVGHVVIYARGAGANCMWQSILLSPYHKLKSSLILQTTHTAAVKTSVVESEGSPDQKHINKLVPLGDLKTTGRFYRKWVKSVSELPTVQDFLTLDLTPGQATTFTVTASGTGVNNYFAGASSAGNIQVRGEGNVLHVTLLDTVNSADALQVKNVKFRVV